MSQNRTVPIIPRPSSSTSYRYVFSMAKNMLTRKYEIYCTSCIRGYCISGDVQNCPIGNRNIWGPRYAHRSARTDIPRSMSIDFLRRVIGFKKVRQKNFSGAGSKPVLKNIFNHLPSVEVHLLIGIVNPLTKNFHLVYLNVFQEKR